MYTIHEVYQTDSISDENTEPNQIASIDYTPDGRTFATAGTDMIVLHIIFPFIMLIYLSFINRFVFMTNGQKQTRSN